MHDMLGCLYSGLYCPNDGAYQWVYKYDWELFSPKCFTHTAPEDFDLHSKVSSNALALHWGKGICTTTASQGDAHFSRQASLKEQTTHEHASTAGLSHNPSTVGPTQKPWECCLSQADQIPSACGAVDVQELLHNSRVVARGQRLRSQTMHTIRHTDIPSYPCRWLQCASEIVRQCRRSHPEDGLLCGGNALGTFLTNRRDVVTEGDIQPACSTALKRFFGVRGQPQPCST